MARILVAYKQFPAPTIGHAGGQSIYRLLESLRERDHDLILVGRIRDEERPHLETIQPLCERVYTVPHHRSLGGPLPLAMARSYLALRQAVIRALHETRPDLLHVEFAQTASVLLGVSHKHTTFRAHDINWFLMEQQAARQQGLARLRSRALARFFRRVEPWLYTRFDLIAAISEGDRRLLAPRCAPQPVLLLPLSPNVSFDPELAPAAPPGPNVLFVGAMSRAFNVQGVTWFLEKVWPRIHAQVPDATFYVVGSSPPESIRAYDDGKSVIVTGFVDDLAPWYRSAAVFVSPVLVAGGLLQKVLDAMGMGVPVVATSVSNHGLAATPGQHLRIADEPEGFAASVIELLRNGEERRRLGAAARRFAAEHYDAEVTMDRWDQALHSLMQRET